MKVYIATCLIGSIAFDAKGKVIDKRLFPKDPALIASRLEKAKTELLQEEAEIIEALKKKGVKEIVFSGCAASRDNPAFKGISCSFEKENVATKILQTELRKMALEFKWIGSQAELNQILSTVNVEITKAKTREFKKDRIAIHAIGMLDETDRVINVLVERLREWYGLYFPELEDQVQSHEKFSELVISDAKNSAGFRELASRSAGMDFSDDDLKQMQEVAKSLHMLFSMKKELTKYVERLMAEALPNFSSVAGPLLGARLLAIAGSLDKLAMMPSSTIQLLGAEKALFRHLKGEGRAPKYGILFGHPLIQQASFESKGKVARLVSAKLSLAARLDKFSGKDQGNEMRHELDEVAGKLSR